MLTIGLNRAAILLAQPKNGARRGPQLLRDLGVHPEGGTVGLYRGRYGPYVSHGGIIASLPKNADSDSFPLDRAIELLAVQRAKGKSPGKKNTGKSPGKGRQPARQTRAAAESPQKAKQKAKPTKAAPGAPRAKRTKAASGAPRATRTKAAPGAPRAPSGDGRA